MRPTNQIEPIKCFDLWQTNWIEWMYPVVNVPNDPLVYFVTCHPLNSFELIILPKATLMQHWQPWCNILELTKAGWPLWDTCNFFLSCLSENIQGDYSHILAVQKLWLPVLPIPLLLSKFYSTISFFNLYLPISLEACIGFFWAFSPLYFP